MNEKPIIFSGEMVRAILDGRKTMTRRVVKPEPVEVVEWNHGIFTPYKTVAPPKEIPQAIVKKPIACPYGKPGDRLWVREAHLLDPPHNGEWDYYAYTDGAIENVDAIPEKYRSPRWVMYAADKEGVRQWRWRPSIHMPRWASRITLEITNVRVERLQGISEEDAKAEGMEIEIQFPAETRPYGTEFRSLWDKINGKKYPWDSNPWVWVVEFKKL